MKEKKAKQKRAKPEKDSASNVANLSLFAKKPASAYEDPSKNYASDDERRRAEIQSMMNKWNHYHAALEAYRFIYVKSSDDYRNMRVCHEKIAPAYVEGQIFQLAINHYIDALKCCIAIPETERTPEDLEAVARIFSLLITGLNELIKRFSINITQIQASLDFCLKNSAELNHKQRQLLTFGAIDVDALEVHTKYPWGKEVRDAASALIKLVGPDIQQNLQNQAGPSFPGAGRK
ncbi:MAG: hypothetical protein SFW07_04385 [Gammaproteobacteria bacterium]|nr:hypothetical protein [Gammaproteobacteria bacterium]